jgi:outer membrane lipase/esterase
MSKLKQFALKSALFTVIILNMFCAVRTAGFNQYIGFGDSTLDSGYWRYNTSGIAIFDTWTAQAVANGDSGAYNGNGVENSIILANKFGLNAIPVGAPGGSGTNYANGGSYTAPNNPRKPYPKSVSAIQQIQNYLGSVNGIANPHALYVIKSGDNDLNFPNPPSNYLTGSAYALAMQVEALQAAGARTIMVPNSYNSAVFAGQGGNIYPSDEAKYATSVAYFSLRWADLSAAGVRFIPADIDSLFKYVVHNPTNFGFTPSSVLAANAPAWNNPPQPPEHYQNHALWALPLTPTQQQTFLFVDDVHLTTAGQTIEADYEYSLLAAPSQASLVVQSAVHNGLAVANTIQRQIDFAIDLTDQSCRTNRANFWATIAPEYLRIKNACGFPGVSGVPFDGTIGVDYRTKCGAIFGLAFTAGYQKQKFSSIGGHFNQTVEAPSLYAAYKYGPAWGNLAATYSAFQNTIKRRVPLGIFIDQNKASPDGSSLGLTLCIGGDFKPGKITTGPVVSMVLQQVHLRGFTETGDSGVTALSFTGQTRNSLVSQLGWRILGDIGKWQPFAQARWNHEWGDKHKSVTASLTSVFAPTYTMAASPVASNWADAWLGTNYQINSHVSLRGAFLATICDRRESYGGELGLNVSF